MTRGEKHAARKAALPPLAVIPHTVAPHVAARRERDAAKAAAHREATTQSAHEYRAARVWPVLGAGWGDVQSVRIGRPIDDPHGHFAWHLARQKFRRANNLRTLPLAGPALASPVRPHDPRQWTPKKVRRPTVQA